jgi:aryl-alcohol dehydrogenase-like predicted oxidoreductase
MEMEQRPFGDTGLTVTPIGLGLAALGRPAYINLGHGTDLGESRDIAGVAHHAHSVLSAAWEGGIRYFDVARSYGRGEHFLSEWLVDSGLSPRDVTVGSKWGYIYVGDWEVDAAEHEVKDHSLATLHHQYAESRGILGAYLDLYQIHSATFDSGVLEDRAVLAELCALRDEGIVVGLTLSGEEQSAVLRRALELEVDGRSPFRAVQATWNLLETSAAGALAEAHEVGWGVIVKEAVANGRLTHRNDADDFGTQRRILRRAADRHGVGMDALVLAAALARPWADVVLSGAATPEQLRSNLEARAVEMDEETQEELELLAEPPARYWAVRDQLQWT